MDAPRTLTNPHLSRRLGWGIVLFILLVSLVLRLSSLLGNHLHWDELFWMTRGAFLVESSLKGSGSSLQADHWTVQGGRTADRKLTSRIATGTVTAALTGAGLEVARRLPRLSPESEPFKQIFCARALHALLSALTPILLFLLLRPVLSDAGALAVAGFLMFEPVIHYWGGMAHLEAFLTLASPLSLILYEYSRRQDSTLLLVAAGAVFGMAFANRANAAAIPIALLVYTVLRLITEYRDPMWLWRTAKKESVRLLLFGATGWVTFFILYPPIWTVPISGSWAFVIAYAGRASEVAPSQLTLFRWMSLHSLLAWVFFTLGLMGLLIQRVRLQRLFQLGAVYYLVAFVILTLPPRFMSRYLSSVLPGLALMGACTIAYLWERTCRNFPKARGLMAWVLPLLATVLCLSTVTAAWQSFRTVKEVYRELHDLRFSEIHFPEDKLKFVRDDGGASQGRLLVSGRGSHVPSVYLGVRWKGKGGQVYDVTQPGWNRVKLEEVTPCRAGDWELGDSIRYYRPNQRHLRFRRLFFWPCIE